MHCVSIRRQFWPYEDSLGLMKPIREKERLRDFNSRRHACFALHPPRVKSLFTPFPSLLPTPTPHPHPHPHPRLSLKNKPRRLPSSPQRRQSQRQSQRQSERRRYTVRA